MKVKLYAYLTEFDLQYIKIEELADVEKLVPQLHYSTMDPARINNVTVGAVEIEVDLLSPDQIVGNAVLSMRSKAAEIRAKAADEAAKLEGKVQQLLAIENKVLA
jgi:hypothetical protein